MSATANPPVAKKLKTTAKPFRTNSSGYKFLIEEFKKYNLDKQTGINPEETDNKVIGLFFDRAPELQSYSRKQFLKTNFRSTSNDFLVENLKSGFRRRAKEKTDTRVGGGMLEYFFYFYFYFFIFSSISHYFFSKKKSRTSSSTSSTSISNRIQITRFRRRL